MAVEIAVTGATGNIGYRVANSLLKDGHQVRTIGRNQESEKMRRLASRGASLYESRLDNSDTLSAAFQGCDVALVMTPAEYQAEDFRGVQINCAKAITEALNKTNTKKVVSISGLGADIDGETGVVRGLFHFENYLNDLAADIVHLRPTYFMENFFHLIHPIKQLGFATSPMSNNAKVPMIATKDVADIAVEYLAHPSFQGKSHRDLLGPQDFTMRDVIQVLGKAIDRPQLKHLRLPNFIVKKGIQASGNSQSLATLSIQMHEAFCSGTISSRRNTGSTTPTTLEEFSADFKRRFESSNVPDSGFSRLAYKILAFFKD